MALMFFQTTGDARVALADPSYKQHNPAFVKGGKEAGAAGPQPPPGNPAEVVVAERDIVTIIHRHYRQDRTAAAGTFYEVFTFDAFRVKDGKLTEHWDGAVINPPAPTK